MAYEDWLQEPVDIRLKLMFTRNLIYDYQYRYATFKCSLHF